MAEPERRLDKDTIAKMFLKSDEELLAKAKSKRDLLVEVYGRTIAVKAYNQRITHNFGNFVGGYGPPHTTGYVSNLEVIFRPIEPLGIKTKKLNFYGHSPIVAGEFFCAGIFLGEKQKLHLPNDDKRVILEYGTHHPQIKHCYVLTRRDFNEQEDALYLQIMRNDQEVRTDFCVDYDFKNFPREP